MSEGHEFVVKCSEECQKHVTEANCNPNVCWLANIELKDIDYTMNRKHQGERLKPRTFHADHHEPNTLPQCHRIATATIV